MSHRKLYIVTFSLLFALSFGLVFSYQRSQPAYATSDHIVILSGDTATPATVSAKVGESVQFNSGDGKTYAIGQGVGKAGHHDHDHDYSGVASGSFGAGEGYRVEFKKQGVYSFHDHTNPKIGIVVIVYDDKR